MFMLSLFALSATPFGLAFWLGSQDESAHMRQRTQKAPLHREMGALAQLFQLPVAPEEIYWREVSMHRPLWGADKEDKALWAIFHYTEQNFKALCAQWPQGLCHAELPSSHAVDVGVFLPWLLEDMEKNMKLKLSHKKEVWDAQKNTKAFKVVYEEVRKVPSALFAAEATAPKAITAYVVPSHKSLLLMRLGAAEFVAGP